jgi:hypothetical protein
MPMSIPEHITTAESHSSNSHLSTNPLSSLSPYSPALAHHVYAADGEASFNMHSPFGPSPMDVNPGIPHHPTPVFGDAHGPMPEQGQLYPMVTALPPPDQQHRRHYQNHRPAFADSPRAEIMPYDMAGTEMMVAENGNVIPLPDGGSQTWPAQLMQSGPNHIAPGEFANSAFGYQISHQYAHSENLGQSEDDNG